MPLLRSFVFLLTGSIDMSRLWRWDSDFVVLKFYNSLSGARHLGQARVDVEMMPELGCDHGGKTTFNR